LLPEKATGGGQTHRHKMRSTVCVLACALASGAAFSGLPRAALPTRSSRVTLAMDAVSSTAVLAKDLAETGASSTLPEPYSWSWKSGGGKPRSFDEILAEIDVEVHERDVEVHVGCDSAVQNGGRVVFATVICLIASGGGHGGRYWYSRSIEPSRHYPVLQTRLLREVELSLQTAEALSDVAIDVQQVHCDSNIDPKCQSTQHTSMLTGYIASMGYRYLVKPDAWATSVADKHSRGLPSLRKSSPRASRTPVFQP
jgi:predicted RNase H-related nuclease YkuK (DUF458 family)